MPYKDLAKQQAYQRERIARCRAAWFADKKCAHCGSTDRLELDHIDRNTKANKGDHCVWSWSKERRESELRKCQPLCHDCHGVKTRLENTPPLVHGVNAYKNPRIACRCGVCTLAARDSMRTWRELRV